MAEAQITAKTSAHRGLRGRHSNYTTAHNAESGSIKAGDYLGVGQTYSLGSYSIYRYCATFDISSAEIPADALIQSVYLRMRYTGDPSGYTNQFQVIIKKGVTSDYPHYPSVEGDYYYLNYTGNGGSINTEDIPDTGGTASFFNINFNDTGKSWINVSDTDFGIVLFSSRDVNFDIPTGSEFLRIFETQYNPTRAPDLFITYFVPTGIPAVGDPTFSNTKATYTKATANVSDAGGGYEERGFEYGISEVATWAVRETGVWGATGDYSLVLPNLLPLTTYYVRAYVTNDYGTGYSDWTSFTTTDVPGYGIYEESNTATICFYVRRAGGKWSIKHGPYTTDQADIEIGKILTEGKGKYQIKFTSDVLTGLSVNIMTKLDIKAR